MISSILIYVTKELQFWGGNKYEVIFRFPFRSVGNKREGSFFETFYAGLGCGVLHKPHV